MIIYLHGSHGTRKAALARGLADKLGGQLLSKEELHKALFPGDSHPLSEEKDGWLCDVLLQATAWNLEIEPTRTIVLDAQRAARAAEIPGLLRFSRDLHQDFHVVECVHPGTESERRPRSHRCRPAGDHLDAVPRDRTHLVDMSAPPSAALQVALSCLHAATRFEPSHAGGSRGSDERPAAMADAH